MINLSQPVKNERVLCERVKVESMSNSCMFSAYFCVISVIYIAFSTLKMLYNFLRLRSSPEYATL